MKIEVIYLRPRGPSRLGETRRDAQHSKVKYDGIGERQGMPQMTFAVGAGGEPTYTASTGPTRVLIGDERATFKWAEAAQRGKR